MADYRDVDLSPEGLTEIKAILIEAEANSRTGLLATTYALVGEVERLRAELATYPPKVDEGLRSPRVVAWLEQDREQVRQEERRRFRSIGWAVQITVPGDPEASYAGVYDRAFAERHEAEASWKRAVEVFVIDGDGS